MISNRPRILVAATLVAAFTLGMLPPASGRGAPETVMRSVRVPVPAPLDPGLAFARDGRDVRSIERAWTSPHTICAPFTFTSVALTWRQAADAVVPVNLRWGDDDLTPIFRTQSDPDHSPDPGTEEAPRVGTPVVWTGEARCLDYQLEMPADAEIQDLRATFLNTSGTASGGSLLGALSAGFTRAWDAFRGTPADAAAPAPPIVTREQWGADESLRSCDPDYADRLRMAYIHHTASGNDYAASKADDVVRAIYAYHTGSRGFCDIAYNFLVDRYGVIYEGRAGGMTAPVIGAHAMGFNTASTGIAVIGDFQTAAPTKASVRSVKRLVAWRLDVAHVDPSGTAIMTSAGGSNQKHAKGEQVALPAVSGHRQTGFTTCPGDQLWKRLNAIRKAARARGLPKIFDPLVSTPSIEIGRSQARVTALLSAPLAWSVAVTDPAGTAVRTWSGGGGAIDVTWNGLGGGGFPVAEGTYTVTISAGSALPASIGVTVTGGCDLATGPGGGTLIGDEGPNVLCGGDGPDTLDGRGGDDILIGLGAADTLIGGAGADLLIGGTGDDTLSGGTEADTLEGGPGDDALDGGTEADTASFEGAAGVQVDLLTGTASGDGSDTLASIENATGSPLADTLLGSGAANALTGGDGNDTLDGRGGDDALQGQRGADTLRGGAGNDALLGQAGRDTADFSATPGPVRVDLGKRIATGEGTDTLSGISRVLGGAHADVLLGSAKRDRLVGGGGNDRLVGRRGNDVLLGSRGRDELRGGAGSDRLRGGGHRDVLRGGPGPDLLHGGGMRDTLAGGGGDDEIRARDGRRDDLNGGGGRDSAAIDRGRDRIARVERIR